MNAREYQPQWARHRLHWFCSPTSWKNWKVTWMNYFNNGLSLFCGPAKSPLALRAGYAEL